MHASISHTSLVQTLNPTSSYVVVMYTSPMHVCMDEEKPWHCISIDAQADVCTKCMGMFLQNSKAPEYRFCGHFLCGTYWHDVASCCLSSYTTNNTFNHAFGSRISRCLHWKHTINKQIVRMEGTHHIQNCVELHYKC